MGWEKEKKNYVLSCKLGMIMNMLPKNITENPEPRTEPPYCNNWIVYFAKDTQGRHLAHSQKNYLILSKRYMLLCLTL